MAAVPGLPETADRTALALAFIVPAYEFFNVVSALESSPWTIENVGADPVKAASARRLLWQAIFLGNGVALAGSLIGGNWLPIAGSGAASVYCWWLYDKAIKRAETADQTSRGSKSSSLSWGNPT